MALPQFDDKGDLPQGLHKATLPQVLARFGQGAHARQQATSVLKRIYELVSATGKLKRFVIFGSYVTAKPEPHDVDVVMVMEDDFSLSACDRRTQVLFDHLRAEHEIGASIFWLCPSTLLRGSLEDFLLGWGTKRDLSIRGIVEVIS